MTIDPDDEIERRIRETSTTISKNLVYMYVCEEIYEYSYIDMIKVKTILPREICVRAGIDEDDNFAFFDHILISIVSVGGFLNI